MNINFLNIKFLSTSILSSALILLLLPGTIFSQGMDIELLGEQLAKKLSASSPSIETSSPEEYKSFIKSQYNNTVNQNVAIGRSIEEDLFLSKLQQERMELASKLCSKDPRSCFLIDEYQDYSLEDVPQTTKDLKIFGLDLFAGYPSSLNTYQSMPVSDDYILKPGDEVTINITGSLNINQEIQISPSGTISVSEVGDILLASLTLGEAEKKFDEFVQSRYLGAETFLSLKKLTLNQVFALGAVNFPGSYNISPLSSVINSLISSGGFKPNASMRDIQIVRKGVTIQTIDLYDFLISGNTNLDWRLLSGDAILVNGTSNHVSIIGEINRPAMYEMQPGELLTDLTSFALGFSPFADLTRISVKRINSIGDLEILNVNLETPFELFPGDTVQVNSKLGNDVNIVKVHGEIKSKGEYSFQPNLFLGDLIAIDEDLFDSTYTLFAAVKRFDEATRSYSIINLDLLSQSKLNKIQLQSKDEVIVFSKDDVAFINSRSLREEYNSIAMQSKSSGSASKSTPLNASDFSASLDQVQSSANISAEPNTGNELKSCFSSMNNIKNVDVQSNIFNKINFFKSLNKSKCTATLVKFPEMLQVLLSKAIPIIGNVRLPGLLPITNSVTFTQIFNYSGGLRDTNFSSYAEAGSYGGNAVSFEINDPVELVNLAYVHLKTRDNIYQSKYISLVGEFVSPGVYPITSNTTLLDVFERAGGLTSKAYPFGAIFSRESIKKSEETALIRTKSELTELMTGAVASGFLKQSSQDLIPLIGLISSVENANPAGRLVTELNPRVISKNTDLNIFLENQDVIYMPRMNGTVTISGSVLNPVTVPYKQGMSIRYYTQLAGGYKKNADKARVYAIAANGEAILARSSRSIFKRESIAPGTTIIIPSKVRVLDGISLVETVTPVLANLAVTAASIAAINNN